MAYVPKDWVTGEVITEQALDHIEQGIANIGGGVLLIPKTEDPETEKHILGKNYAEIKTVVDNGGVPFVAEYGETTIDFRTVGSISENDSIPSYTVFVNGADGLETYKSDSPTGVLTELGGDIG